MKRFFPDNRPSRPSLTKITDYVSTAITTVLPTQENDGIDVRDWLAVLITANAHVPAVGTGVGTAAEAYLRCRIWRWRKTASHGAGVPSGQWFADTQFQISLNGDIAAVPMERSFFTANAEKIFIEVEEIVDPSTNLVSFALGVYGLGPKRGEEDGVEGVNVSAAVVSEAAAGGTTLVYATDPTDPTTVELGLVDAGYRVVISGTGATDPTNYTTAALALLDADYRLVPSGAGDHDVATADRLLRVGAVATDVDLADVGNGDDVHLVSLLDGKLIQAGYNRVGDYERSAEVDPIDQRYVNDKLVDLVNVIDVSFDYYLDMDGYRRCGFQLEISGSGNTTIKFYGTVQDDDPDLTARTYQDVTLLAYSAGSFTVSNMLPDTAEFWASFSAIKVEVAVVGGPSTVRVDSKRLY